MRVGIEREEQGGGIVVAAGFARGGDGVKSGGLIGRGARGRVIALGFGEVESGGGISGAEVGAEEGAGDLVGIVRGGRLYRLKRGNGGVGVAGVDVEVGKGDPGADVFGRVGGDGGEYFSGAVGVMDLRPALADGEHGGEIVRGGRGVGGEFVGGFFEETEGDEDAEPRGGGKLATGFTHGASIVERAERAGVVAGGGLNLRERDFVLRVRGVLLGELLNDREGAIRVGLLKERGVRGEELRVVVAGGDLFFDECAGAVGLAEREPILGDGEGDARGVAGTEGISEGGELLFRAARSPMARRLVAAESRTPMEKFASLAN